MSKKEKNREFKIDPAHSNIGFKVKHMMVASVNGRFTDYEGQLLLPGENFEKASLRFTAKTASINTNNEERDQHLRSADFFNAALYPELYFESTGIKKVKSNFYRVAGFLKMNGIKNPIQLEAQFNGILMDPAGIERVPLTMYAKIDRLNWNMKWNKPLESGGILVSKEVNLIIECEFI